MNAQEIIDHLQLEPHPEGGFFRQTWVEDRTDGQRPAGTSIYFLLQADQPSHWHRVDAVEIWHYYAGAPLTLSQAETKAGPARSQLLGPDLAAGQFPQLIVPQHHWQAAHTMGAYTLVGCTVSPGFRFAGFELAVPGFSIPSL